MMIASVESKNNEVYKTEKSEVKKTVKPVHKNTSTNVYKEKIELLREMTEIYTSKLQFCVSFLSYLSGESRYASTTNASGIYGSFLRKIFEFPYALLEYINSDDTEWKSGYGNFMNGDIDIFILPHSNLPSAHIDSCKGKEEMFHILNKLNVTFGMYLATRNEIFRPKFGSYFYDGHIQTTEYVTENTPSCSITYRLFFTHQNGNHKFHVDLTSCLSEKCVDLSINNLKMTTHGLCSQNSQSFIHCLNDIINKQTRVFNHSFVNIEESVWTNPTPRDVKVSNLNLSISFIKKRLLKIIEKGYSLKGYFLPVIEIEKNEDCIITSIKAPYPTLQLSCMHKISLMAYIGVVNKGALNFSEAIRCPYCRNNMSLNLVTYPSDDKLYYNHLSSILKLTELHSATHKDETKTLSLSTEICSKDAVESLSESFNTEEESERENEPLPLVLDEDFSDASEEEID